MAWQCYQQVRAAYAHRDLRAGKQIAQNILGAFASCPIPEVARLGWNLRQWSQTLLSYRTTDRPSNAGTEATNGTIELHRGIARGYRNRDNCGGLDVTRPPEVARAGYAATSADRMDDHGHERLDHGAASG